MCKLNTTELKTYSLEELIKWRNSASSRVSKIDEDVKYLVHVMAETYLKVLKLQRKRKKDVQWIVKLNKALDFKVFKTRS
jgi:hypothetical protein